jgi:hypothetical protein
VKNKFFWSVAIVLFLGAQVSVGLGYHAVANWLDATLEAKGDS